jgi:apolipoprotein D and lipocalin family protein
MKKISLAPLAIVIALTVSLLAACTSAPPAPMATVASVDLNRYLGNWYQVSMIPNSFQKMCVADTQANYALQDTWTGDSIRVTNRCRKSDGTVEAAVGVAKIVPDSSNAKLKVAFFRPFYGNYWILALGEQGANYDWVLVGEPKREYGWVLSRTPTLDAVSLNAVMQRAEAVGYQRSQFVTSPQTQPLN